MDDHHLQLTDASRPVIIIAPGYGQVALDYAALAYYLAAHQFRVLRYDPTNHLGNSDGELQHTTLRSLQHDLDKVIEFVRDTWPQAPVLVIASDLGARAALKSAVQIRPLDLLLLVNPAVDVRHLLMTAHGHDLLADYQFGLRRGVCNVLGLNVNVDQFVGDLIAGRCADLDSTLEDLRLIRSPLCIATTPAVSAALPPADLPHAFMTHTPNS
jgi:pimeloyl-ACP methyl ester carboxylesterase